MADVALERVRVKNTDGSVHHEVVVAFEPGHRCAVRMELSPPASYLMDRIEEEVTLEDTAAGGSRITRRFTLSPRSIVTAPVVWIIAKVLLRQAVIAHDAAVRDALERG